MAQTFQVLNRIKQALLLVSIVYFYGLSIALTFHFPTYGLDKPIAFAVAGVVFLVAIILESGLVWWHRRRSIGWIVMVILCYAILGFVIAPLLYGWDIVWIPLLAPLAVVFVGGFIVVYIKIIHRAFSRSMKLSNDTVIAALPGLPGWEFLADTLEKTFRSSSYTEASDFMARAMVLARTHHREPELILVRRALKVRVATPDVGVTQADLEYVKELNSI
ncbi:MAG: 4a-hydroxytetrahydrobiopterin dehydratase [Patescibacteria group bacterium]